MSTLGISNCFILLVLGLVGCSTGSDSSTLALDQTLDAAGFLVASDISVDPLTAGSFLVSCAYKSGLKQLKYSRAEVEQNKICPLDTVAAKVETGGEPVKDGSAGTGASSGAGQYSVSLSNTNYTYVKARPSLNVSANVSQYKEGVDYCIINSKISAGSACAVTSGSEIQVSGLALSGCELKVGYLWVGHVAVAPPPPACQ